jgi:hypothetical protein
MASLLDRGYDENIRSERNKFVLKRMFIESGRRGVLLSAQRGLSSDDIILV